MTFFLDGAARYKNILARPPEAPSNFLMLAFGRRESEVAKFSRALSPSYVQLGFESDAAILAVAHTPTATIRKIEDRDGRFAGLVWGVIFDAESGSERLAIDRCLAAAAAKDGALLKKNGGLYVAVLFDRRDHKLVFINDCLGARPFFVAARSGLLYGSSHALALADILPGPRRANPDAISEYLTFGFNATNHSLIGGIDNLEAASLTICDPAGNVDQSIAYDVAAAQSPPLGQRAMAARLADIIGKSYRHWTQHADNLVFGLSGGYDSRLLCALSRSHGAARQRYINVGNMRSETVMAQIVADRLGVPLEVVDMAGDRLSHYAPENSFHCRPDGFPTTKGLARLVFRQARPARMVDGYLAGAVVRGHLDHILPEALKAADTSEAVTVILQKNAITDLPFLKPAIGRAALARAFGSAAKTVARYNSGCHSITAFDLYIRQRSLITRNFLQNLDEAEPCLPYFDPELIALKRTYPYADFGLATYQEIFRLLAPDLVDLPHNKDMKAEEPKDKVSRQERARILRAIARYAKGEGRSYLDTTYVLAHLGLGLFSPKHIYTMTRLMFIDMLNHVCATNGIGFDWNELA